MMPESWISRRLLDVIAVERLAGDEMVYGRSAGNDWEDGAEG